jgi:ornithine carbamoyltransferase
MAGSHMVAIVIALLLTLPSHHYLPHSSENRYSRLLAKDIVMYQTRISIKEAELKEIRELEQFRDYCQVFNQFLFGTVTQSLLLLHCYPIESRGFLLIVPSR